MALLKRLSYRELRELDHHMPQQQGSTLLTLSGLKATRLGNEREAYVYVPESYGRQPERRYPVLYMHVGQHVFEPVKSNGEAWRMHEVLDRLIAEQLIEDILLVAVEHKYEDGKSEYFHDHSAYPIQCVGGLYEHFLVHELKPYIDRIFRTLPGPEHTALMGSSAAGIATYNIGLRNPDTFGMLGMLSPFFVQVDPRTLVETKQYRLYETLPSQKLWLDIGGMEGFFMPRHVKEVALALLQAGYPHGEKLLYLDAPLAAHTEPDWGKRAHMPLLHFFGRRSAATVSVELHGADTIGLAGPGSSLNPVVTLDNGLAYTDLAGEYEVLHPELLAISPDGMLHPLAPGATVVLYRQGALEARRSIRIAEALAETIILDIEIDVPPSTPDDDYIYATFPVPKLRKGLYGGQIPLPRGLRFLFNISRGYDLHETDEQGLPIAPRTIIADRDQSVRYSVHGWSDQLPAAGSATGGELS